MYRSHAIDDKEASCGQQDQSWIAMNGCYNCITVVDEPIFAGANVLETLTA